MIYVIAYQPSFWYDSSIELLIRLSPEGVDPDSEMRYGGLRVVAGQLGLEYVDHVTTRP